MSAGRHMFVRFGAASLVSAVIDLAVFTFAAAALFPDSKTGIAASTVIARVVSGGCNFLVNRGWVFHTSGTARVQVFKYLILFLAQMACSALLVMNFAKLPLPLTVVKGLADGLLFLVSYQIQHRLIFLPDERGGHI